MLLIKALDQGLPTALTLTCDFSFNPLWAMVVTHTCRRSKSNSSKFEFR